MIACYDFPQNSNGWTVFDIWTGEPTVAHGVPQTGLEVQHADEAAEVLTQWSDKGTLGAAIATVVRAAHSPAVRQFVSQCGMNIDRRFRVVSMKGLTNRRPAMPTYSQIRDRVQRDHGFVPQPCWIAHVLATTVSRAGPQLTGVIRLSG